MQLRSQVPFRNQNAPMLPDVGVFGQLQREIDRLFGDLTRGIASTNGVAMLTPSIDVSETGKVIEITVDLPGLERKDVEISLEGDALTIRGEKTESNGEENGVKADRQNGQRTYHVAERSYGVFYRVIHLPPGIDPAKVEATMSKGVLKIRLPKPQGSTASKIEVKEAV
jgi:HSP20 family protein